MRGGYGRWRTDPNLTLKRQPITPVVAPAGIRFEDGLSHAPGFDYFGGTRIAEHIARNLIVSTGSQLS